VRSLSERTTTRAGSSCEWGGCSRHRDASYILPIHITPPSAVRSSLENPLPRRGRRLKRPSPKRQRSRSAGVGFRINNPHQVVGRPQNPPEVPLVQGGTLFSSNVVAWLQFADPQLHAVHGQNLHLLARRNQCLTVCLPYLAVDTDPSFSINVGQSDASLS
jgi:hypothetical protein